MTLPPDDGPLAGRTIAITAERKSEEQAKLFRRRGATVVYAPTMHTVDLTDDVELHRQTEAIIDHPPDWTVATTGFGMRLWFEAADEWGMGDRLLAALGSSRVVARGPKAQSACRQRGLEIAWTAPRESMPEVVEWLATQDGIGDARVAVQLFDPEDHPSTAEMRSFARDVVEVSIYRWRPPLDPVPALQLARDIAARSVDAVTFTSQPAVRFLVDIAADAGVLDAMVEAFNDGSVLPVCVGPVCASAGEEAGITTMVWPEPFRLAPMVRLAEERLATSRDGSPP
jgi:uroporphyrinogen-III synthase